jgi:Flp pilus assembly protein TadD
MSEVTRSQNLQHSIPSENEEARLEFALHDSDRLLTDSLRVDERRRRVRRLVTVTLFVGGILMGTTLIAVFAGWLTLAAPPPAGQAEQEKEAWVKRLSGLREHMHTAFGVGPDLTLLDPDLGLKVVQQAWPKITVPEVKTGLLKTFAFSKALPEKHPKVLQVLHLGMTDEDPEIRAYAAGYVEEYSGQDFSNDAAAYTAWYRKNAQRSPKELLALQEAPAERPADRAAPADKRDAVARADTHAAQGWQLWRQQKMAEAAQEFEQAVALDPDSANSWNGLGWARFNSGDVESAIKAFERCLELDRNHPAGLNGLGQAYFMWGELDKAEKYLLKSAKPPAASAAWHGLAKLYLLNGKYDLAQKWIRTCLRGLNKPVGVLGISEQEKEQQQSMLKEMLAAAKAGQVPDALRRRIEPPGKPANSAAARAASEGWQQFNAGQLRAAELSFNRALAKDPENLAAMNGLGFLLLNTGKTAEAKQLFERYLELEPDAAGPMNGLARCLKSEGQVEDAVALWEKMYKLYPGPNAAAVGLAQTYVEQKEYAKALPYFEELVKAMPDNEEFSKGLEAAKQGADKGESAKDSTR